MNVLPLSLEGRGEQDEQGLSTNIVATSFK